MPTEKQIAALRYLVAKARLHLSPKNPAISVVVSQLVWRLIQASEGLTKPVFITLNEATGDFTREEVHEIGWVAGSLTSGNSTTHLAELLTLMGSDFRFNLHYGAHDADGKFNTDGQFAHQDGHHDARMRYTFWLAPGTSRGTNGTEVRVTRAELEAIDLTQDGLYSTTGSKTS